MTIEELIKILPHSEGRLLIQIDDISKVSWSKEKGQTLQKWRKERGLTLKEMATNLAEYGQDYTTAYWSKLEVGKAKDLEVDILVFVCLVLNVDIREFVSAVMLTE